MLNRKLTLILSTILILCGITSLLFNNELLYIIIPFLYLILTIYILYFYKGLENKLLVKLSIASFIWLILEIISGAFMDVFTRFFICTILYYIISLWLLKYMKPKINQNVVLFLIIGPSILLFTIYIFRRGDIAFKPIGLCSLIGFGLANISFKGGYIINTLKITLCCIVIVILSYIAYPNLFYSFNGVSKNENDSRVELALINEVSDTINIKKIDAKVVVLDYWYTGCGVCFQKFPILQEVSDKYKNDKDVYVASVNIPLNKEPYKEYGFTQLKKYRFNKLNTILYQGENPWSISQYPMVLIFDKNKKLRYEGQLNIDKNAFVNNTYSLIEQLKNE